MQTYWITTPNGVRYWMADDREHAIEQHIDALGGDEGENVLDVNTATDPPRYVHDCDRCIFLGRHGTADLYVCPAEPTVIARHSSEGSNYSSGLSFVGPRGIAALTEAYDRAVARGLL